MIEIERKFLVSSDAYKEEAVEQQRIVQGYLNSDPKRTVRVRIKGDKAFITVKGKSNEAGLSRYEWEEEIKSSDAEDLLKLCEPGKIDKTRFLVKSGGHVFEVDEFYGDNEGLVIAEVELASEEEDFRKPDWLGKEVSGEKRYFNSGLISHPYNEWKNQQS